ncbi:MAG: hypothetical protein R3F11_11025 [Verrucomicrobiales bacterium]
MNHTILTYSLYLTISIGMTIWVARTLFKNGRLFLVDTFRGNGELADSVNRLLVVGFYLVNIGFVSLYLRIADEVESARGVFDGARREGRRRPPDPRRDALLQHHCLHADAAPRALLRHEPPPVPPTAYAAPRDPSLAEALAK